MELDFTGGGSVSRGETSSRTTPLELYSTTTSSTRSSPRKPEPRRPAPGRGEIRAEKVGRPRRCGMKLRNLHRRPPSLSTRTWTRIGTFVALPASSKGADFEATSNYEGSYLRGIVIFWLSLPVVQKGHVHRSGWLVRQLWIWQARVQRGESQGGSSCGGRGLLRTQTVQASGGRFSAHSELPLDHDFRETQGVLQVAWESPKFRQDALHRSLEDDLGVGAEGVGGAQLFDEGVREHQPRSGSGLASFLGMKQFFALSDHQLSWKVTSASRDGSCTSRSGGEGPCWMTRTRWWVEDALAGVSPPKQLLLRILPTLRVEILATPLLAAGESGQAIFLPALAACPMRTRNLRHGIDLPFTFASSCRCS